MQLVADVGLVGLPNAGKSLLRSAAAIPRSRLCLYDVGTNLGSGSRPSQGFAEEVRGRRSAVGGATKNELKRRQKRGDGRRAAAATSGPSSTGRAPLMHR